MPPHEKPAVSFVRSAYTLAEPWPDGRGLLLNLLSGAADVVPRATLDFVRAREEAALDEADPRDALLLDHGYYVEARAIEAAVARHVARGEREKARRQAQPKYMLSLTLRCNLACRYCWQVQAHGSGRQRSAVMSPEMARSAFDFIERDLAARGRSDGFVSLFGGEPLIDTPAFHSLVRAMGERAAARGLQLHFTTNGRHLRAFAEEVRRFRPSLQVTVDGARVEGARVVLLRDGRPLPEAYELLAEWAGAGMTGLGLRFLLRSESVAAFAALGERIFADARFGPGFCLAAAPLHDKDARSHAPLEPKVRVLQALAAELRGRPWAPRVSWLDWRSLGLLAPLRAGQALLPRPVFYHCEANLALTCFGHDGRLYTCYEAIGDPELAVGTYWPRLEIDDARLAQYRERSPLDLPGCAACALAPLCGGGCQVRGFKRQGTFARPECGGLPDEVRAVLRAWPDFSALVAGATHAA